MIKQWYNNWKNLEWYGKTLAIPGILIFMVFILIVSPLIIMMGMMVYTAQVFGFEGESNTDIFY